MDLDAFDEGFSAAELEQSEFSNPYNPNENQNAYLSWVEGWHSGTISNDEVGEGLINPKRRSGHPARFSAINPE